MRIFLYEFLTGGGCWSLGDDPPSGSLLAEGIAMRDALAADLAAAPDIDAIHLLHDQRLPSLELSHKLQFHLADEFADALITIEKLAGHKPPAILIAPEFSGILQTLAQSVEKSGGKLLSPCSEIVAICSDKQRTSEHLFWSRHEVPTPRGISFSLRPPLELAPLLLPAVLKPNDGCGSQGVQMIESVKELAAADFGSATVWRLENYHVGTHVSVGVLTGTLGVIPLQPCLQRLSDDGRFTYLGGSTPIPEHLVERAKRLAKAAAESLSFCRGYLGIDMVLGSAENGSQDVVIEINPRLTTSYLVLRQACEQNLAEAMLQWAVGEPVELTWRPQPFEYSVPCTA